MAQVEPNPVLIERNILRMLLALDAVSHKQTPLWLQYYPAFNQILLDLKSSADQGKRDLFYQQLNELNGEYELVRPAMYVSHPTEIVDQLDAQIAFLTNSKREVWQNEKQLEEHLDRLAKQIDLAFNQQKSQSVQSLLWTSLTLAFLICSVLAYVAWRKYRGEKYKAVSLRRKEEGKNID